MDRPILAEMVIDPLFREFITLEPFNKRIWNNMGIFSVGKYADHDGFLIGENTFAGRRTWENCDIDLAILDDDGYIVGQNRTEFTDG